MTGYEVVSILIGILALLIAFGSFVIALLSFLEKKRRQKWEYPFCLLRDSYVWYYIDSNADTRNAIAGLYSISYGRSKVPVFDGNFFSDNANFLFHAMIDNIMLFIIHRTKDNYVLLILHVGKWL